MADTSSTLRQAEQHLKSGRHEQARALLQRALQKAPGDAELNSSMCFVLQRMGQPEQAMHFGRRALAAKPHDTAFIKNLANIFGLAGAHAEAAEVLERVVALQPGDSSAWTTLSAAYFMYGSLARAEEAARRGRAAHPHHPRIAEQLSAATRKLGKTLDAYEVMRDATLHHPDDLEALHEAAFNANYPSGLTPMEIFEAHTRFGAAHARAARRISITRPGPGDAERPLRIGFISPDFRQHSVIHYAEPLISRLDRTRFGVHLYFLHPKPDAMTERFKGYAQSWCAAFGMSDDVLAQRIALDRIDILIDLAGLTGGTKPGVLARKPAPILATYLGYPNTTGIDAVDYRFIDSVTDPPGQADALAVERLWRLDPCFLCFRAPAESPDVGTLPALTRGAVMFGSFNAGMKFSDRCIELWAGVLRSVSGSRLLIKNYDLKTPEARARLCERFRGAGTDPERLELVSYADSTAEHLRQYHRVDIGLDSFPYHGTTTTCEAFHMGIPVVTLEGEVHAARVGCSLLRAIGLPELIARDDAEFARIAAGIAADLPRLASLRASMRERQRASPLGDEPRFAERFGEALRAVWREACAAGASNR